MADRHPHASKPGFTRGPRIADLMTPEFNSFVDSATEAERAGDAETALAYHRGVPMFLRGAHSVQLTQLADVSEEMTPWIWARWAAYQCTRVDDSRLAMGQRQRAALDYTVRYFAADDLEAIYRAGGDPTSRIAEIMGESWVFHQLCTFEMGGLQCFLETRTAGRLADGASWAREWAGARMNGYRVVARNPLTVVDLRTDHRIRLLDLGAALHADVEGWLIGRVVPSGTSPELMFDSRPIAVDERTAREVARDRTHGGWVRALGDALDEGRVDEWRLESEDRELVSDVPSLMLLKRGTPASALPAALTQLARGRDEIGRAAHRVLMQVAEGRFGPDEDAAFVAAAVLHPSGHEQTRRSLDAATSPERWMRWADLVPDPARTRLQWLAAGTQSEG